MKIRVKLLSTGVEYIAEYIGQANDLTQYKRWQTSDYTQWTNERLECDKTNSYHGYWIEQLSCRIQFENYRDINDETGQWQRLPYAVDKHDKEIKVGDTIYYAMRSLVVSRMKVTSIGKGNDFSKIYGVDLDTNKKTNNSYPKRCIVV